MHIYCVAGHSLPIAPASNNTANCTPSHLIGRGARDSRFHPPICGERKVFPSIWGEDMEEVYCNRIKRCGDSSKVADVESKSSLERSRSIIMLEYSKAGKWRKCHAECISIRAIGFIPDKVPILKPNTQPRAGNATFGGVGLPSRLFSGLISRIHTKAAEDGSAYGSNRCDEGERRRSPYPPIIFLSFSIFCLVAGLLVLLKSMDSRRYAVAMLCLSVFLGGCCVATGTYSWVLTFQPAE